MQHNVSPLLLNYAIAIFFFIVMIHIGAFKKHFVAFLL